MIEGKYGCNDRWLGFEDKARESKLEPYACNHQRESLSTSALLFTLENM